MKTYYSLTQEYSLEEGLIITIVNSESSLRIASVAQIQRNCNLELYFWIFFCNEEDKLVLFFKTNICACGKSLENVKPTLTHKAMSAQMHKEGEKAVLEDAANLPCAALNGKQFRHLLRMI